jgi:hypothetical protein
MSFTEGIAMPRLSAKLLPLATAVGAVALLSACAETRLRDAPDFGDAVRENQAAQIADPDARYAGTPAPGSNGVRAAGAQDRYLHGHVTPPPNVTTSQVGGGGGGGASQ